MDELETLRNALQDIVDCYVARSEIYTNDEHCAAALAHKAAMALESTKQQATHD